VNRPVPPSNWKAADGNVREDLRRLRQYLVELEDYVDSVAQGAGLTQAQADALYLKRAAADFSTFTAKATPTASDILLIEDAAAGFAKKSVTVGDAAIAGIYARGAKPLWVPPAVAGGLDDEFDSTTLNSAWLFRDTTAGVNRTPTFVSPLDPNTALTGATTPPEVAVHTNGRKSHLLLKSTTTGPAAYLMYKPFTYTTGHFYWVRLGHLMQTLGFTPGVLGFGLYAASGGFPDLNNRIQVYYSGGNNGLSMFTAAGGATNTDILNLTTGVGYPEYLCLWNKNATGSPAWYGEAFTEYGARIGINSSGGESWAPTPAFIGFIWTNTAAPDVAEIDFIRETLGHPLYNQT
jgi:hypothetical protein